MKNTNSKIVIVPDYGKVPPQVVDAEKAVLGTCLINSNAINNIIRILQPVMFYLESHQKIFASIISLNNRGITPDLISLSDRLRTDNELESVGGPLYLAKLTENVFNETVLIHHAMLIKEKWLLREYIRCGNELSGMAYTEDLVDVIEYAESSLVNISNFTQNKDPKRIDRCVDEYLIEIEKIINKEKKLSGVPSGFTTIDRITGGWQNQNLIIIAGRPSMGKTAVALALGRGTAEMGFPVGIFSLEMSEQELTGRYLSAVSGRTNTELRAGRVNLEQLGIESNKIAELPIYIDDTASLTVFELKSKIKKLILRAGIKTVIVDYLQLMKAEAKSREQEVSQISRGLKGIAKELHIPIIALSQLNRSVEDRQDKKPRLSDLRKSGAIEQDADIVAFIHRPAYYEKSTAIVNGNDMSTKGLMIFDIAKNRNGACVTIPLYHNEALTKIYDEELLGEAGPGD